MHFLNERQKLSANLFQIYTDGKIFCKFFQIFLSHLLSVGGVGLVLLAYLKFFRLFCVKKLENLEIHLKGLLWVSTKWL